MKSLKFSSIVYVGSANWIHPAWNKAFYPDGLPEDWLLPFYNTQFQSVYLPAYVWQAVSKAVWTQWLNDTQEGFYFVLEPAAEAVAQPASDRVLLATPEWAVEHIWWLDESSDLRALAQRMAHQATTGEPLFVFSRSADIGLMQQVNTLRQVMGC